MGRITQGDGSNPSGPIVTSGDRKRLAAYDRAIQVQKTWLAAMRYGYGSTAKIEARLLKLDAERRALRGWMKGYNVQKP